RTQGNGQLDTIHLACRSAWVLVWRSARPPKLLRFATVKPFVRPEHLADVRGVQAHHPCAARSSAPLSARGWLARVTTIRVVIARVPPLNAAIMHRYGARLPPALRNTPFQSKSDRRRSTSRSARCP